MSHILKNHKNNMALKIIYYNSRKAPYWGGGSKCYITFDIQIRLRLESRVDGK